MTMMIPSLFDCKERGVGLRTKDLFECWPKTRNREGGSIESSAVYLMLHFHSTGVRSFSKKKEKTMLTAKHFISMLSKHYTTTILVRLLSPL